jgi:diphthamide synthase (EF-2-diphthine--ammonia ligase)
MLIHDFINTGFKTLICSADVNFFKEEQVGKTIDFAFLKSLPVGVDPCGENGEFHTFVYDGPIFQHPIPVTLDSVIKCDYTFKKKNDDSDVDEVISSYWFQELIAG